MDIGDFSYLGGRESALEKYSLCYDWMQPYLNSTEDETIRDKLATLADEVYYELNKGGADLESVYFTTIHAPGYSAMGIAGCVLSDYTNPNNLSLNSTPSDWYKVGTEYLFVNDSLHNWNKSLINMTFDSSGKYTQGRYKFYFIDDFLWWFQVYSHFNNENIFDVYPIAMKAVTSELWDSLPNRYSANYGTYGQVKVDYHRGIINLLDDNYKKYMLTHDDIIENSELLPYVKSEDSAEISLLYLIYNNYSTIPRENPSWTSHFDPTSFYQVFRGSWQNDSDWLSLITWPEGLYTRRGRDMGHHDQLSFEYYSRGDLLLADGGENKGVLDKYYGAYGIFHNTILIEDPRTPFGTSSWSDSQARGIFKGNANGLTTPVYIKNIINTSWMESVDINATLEKVIGSSWACSQSLSSPINYERAILYPEKDYFAIIDRLEGSEPWVYRNLFRPTSLNITPSTGTTESEVGHVNIDLTIGSTPYNWLSLPYKTETPTGITTNSIKWNTTNPYGNEVNMHLFSSPASEIIVTRHVTRIAGYGSKSEVFLPLVYFRSNETKNHYRVTVLLARYPTEEEKIPENIAVTGNGTAVKVTSSDYEDFIYTGDGTSSFGDIATDAKTLFLRKTTQPSEYTFMEGSYINYSDSPLLEVSSKIDYLTLKKTGENITFKIKGTGTVNITLYQMNPSVSYQVKRDGEIYSDWVLTDDGRMIITTDLSEHTFEIEQTTPDTTPPTISSVNATSITPTTAVITWETDEKATSLVKYGTSSGSYPYSKEDTSYTTSHSITLTDLSPNTTYYFLVNSTDKAGNPAQSTEYSFNTPALPTIKGDINQDGKVNSLDYSLLVAKWFKTTDITQEDLNKDGIVNVRDLGILMSNWKE